MRANDVHPTSVALAQKSSGGSQRIRWLERE